VLNSTPDWPAWPLPRRQTLCRLPNTAFMGQLERRVGGGGRPAHRLPCCQDEELSAGRHSACHRMYIGLEREDMSIPLRLAIRRTDPFMKRADLARGTASASQSGRESGS